MGYLTDLTDAQWAFIESIIPPQEGPGRRRTVGLRRVIDALMYLDRTGCQWRLLPLDFPPSGTVRYYFDKWNADGTLCTSPEDGIRIWAHLRVAKTGVWTNG